MIVDRPDRENAPYVRFVQIDALRGFAVLGIYWINICIFALPAIDGNLPPDLNDDSLINTIIGIFSEIYVEGTMRGLFSLLFGASALIFLDEAKLATSGIDLVDRYYRRTLLLILFGIVHAYLLLWPHDVLYAYGLFGLFLFPMRKLSARTLFICAIVLLVIGDIKYIPAESQSGARLPLDIVDIMDGGEDLSSRSSNVLEDKQSPDLDNNNPETAEVVDESNKEPVPWEESSAKIRTEMLMDIYRSGYAVIFSAQVGGVVEKQSLEIYQDFVFDIGGMMLLGMALFKLGVLTGQLGRTAYLQLLLVGYLLGSVIRFAIATDSPDPDPGYNLGRMFIALGHLGLIGLICSSSSFRFIVRYLASVGRMALTNYIMQTVISIFLFYGIGFALYGEFERYQLVLICIGVWLFQIVYSNIWLSRFKQGPLEWLWRSMIYGKMQANLRVTGSGPGQ